MASRVTLKHVATLAGVGTATVERVLNGRGGVRPQLSEKVVAAALKLDYPKRLPDMHRGILRIEVIMVQPELTFTTRLARSFERIGSSLDRSIVIHRTLLKKFDPRAIAAHLLDPKARRAALIVCLPDHPVVRDALTTLFKSGLPIVQIVTRIEGLGSPFVGIDNVAAGRMAGLMMMALQPKAGTVAAICHSQILAVHRERVRGFSDFLSRPENQRHALVRVGFAFDNAAEIARQAKLITETWPDLVGLYGVGGDYGPLCQLLGRLKGERSICFIGHELTEESRSGLQSGIVNGIIDQAPETQARRAIDTVLRSLGVVGVEVETAPIRFITITAENL